MHALGVFTECHALQRCTVRVAGACLFGVGKVPFPGETPFLWSIKAGWRRMGLLSPDPGALPGDCSIGAATPGVRRHPLGVVNGASEG